MLNESKPNQYNKTRIATNTFTLTSVDVSVIKTPFVNRIMTLGSRDRPGLRCG
jgi:hypothetical protein